MENKISEKTLYQYLKEYAKEEKDKTCLFDDEKSLSAENTLIKTQAYARALCNAGIGEGDFVALQTKRSVEATLILYALQTVGAVAVLCHPHEKVKKFLDGTGVEMPLKAYITRENGKAWEIVEGDSSREFEPDYSEKPFHICTDAKKATLIIFTSGSTSVSKAVMLSQSNMINNAIKGALAGWYAEEEIGMVITPLYHLLSLMMIFNCIIVRYALFFPEHADPDGLFGGIEKHKITFIHGVPTTFITAAASEQRQKYDLNSLKMGMMAGGACPTEQARRLEKELGIVIIQSYGLSEAVGITTMARKDSIEERTCGVGKVFPITEACVKSADGKILPRGESGEVCSRGVCIMVGYYNNPKANEEAFDADGWFHTGDLGYFDENDILHLNGRKKDVIIRGGENISGAKIESAVSSLDFVQMAVVVGVRDETYGEIPCAMVVPSKDGVTENSVKEALRGVLLKNELPDKIMITENIPLLGTGKPDKLKIKKIFENGI